MQKTVEISYSARNKERPVWGVLFFYVADWFYLGCLVVCALCTKSAKSYIVIFIALIILAIVQHEGHLGVPSDENFLLLLNVVASRPLFLANPEQLNPLCLAIFSIACHSISCSILFFSLCFLRMLVMHRLNCFIYSSIVQVKKNVGKNTTFGCLCGGVFFAFLLTKLFVVLLYQTIW